MYIPGIAHLRETYNKLVVVVHVLRVEVNEYKRGWGTLSLLHNKLYWTSIKEGTLTSFEYI